MLCPPPCGLLLYQEFSKGELSYKARKCAITHSRGQKHQQHIFLVRAEDACEAIISSRASAHCLHEVLLFDRKFNVISYQIKKVADHSSIERSTTFSIILYWDSGRKTPKSCLHILIFIFLLPVFASLSHIP